MSHVDVMMQDRDFAFGPKRSSGLFSVLKWFGNKESVSAPSPDSVHSASASSSCDSIESVASFAFVPPGSYKPFGAALQAEKFILSGPETSTYRARLAQREARLETDRNLTLRSKYNLYKGPEPDRGHSLPLMSKTSISPPGASDRLGMHRRTMSESSKLRSGSSGAHCHVKGKRRAPQPPGRSSGTDTLRRKKRLAPQPPHNPDVICNDSLKLDHGILKPAKQALDTVTTTAKKTTVVQEVVQVSPRPWYKRTLSKSSTPEKKPDQEKRKSGLSFLTNISELDREAMEIVNKETLKLKYLKNAHQQIAPAFMRPRGSEHVRTNSDSWLSPKRKSARDLIAKFNAITGVARGSKEQTPPAEEPKQEVIIPVVQEVRPSGSQAEKKEVPKTTAVVKPISRAQWNCPKCTLENDYWRIICKVCSTIKPYFDDFTSISNASTPFNQTRTNPEENKLEKKDSTDLFGLGSVECRISDLQRSVFQSQYPRLSQNFNCTTENNEIELEKTLDKNISQPKKLPDNKLNLNIDKLENEAKNENMFQPQYPRINLNLNSENLLAFSKFSDKKATESGLKPEKERNSRKEDPQKIEKIILGDELGFSKPNKNETKNQPSNTDEKTKIEKMILGDEISVEKPDYVNVNKYESAELDKVSATNINKPQKIEKMILGDELSVKKSPKTITNHKISETTTTKSKQTEEDKKDSAKREEREKLKKMLIEMKNSLPKRSHKQENNENKHRVSLIQEQIESETPEDESTEDVAEVIVATTETVYENIKVKQENADKPVKVSSAAQTNAILRRNLTPEETSTIQDSKSGFQLIGATDFVGISNERTQDTDGAHTYANLDTGISGVSGVKLSESVLAGRSQTDTLEINRLVRRLEAAIAGGELGQAAVLARDLAELKVPISVVRHRTNSGHDTEHTFDVEMYVEDRISHRGPFPLRVSAGLSVRGLKELVEQQYRIPVNVQRWILGKQLAHDDTATLQQHHIITAGCPVFLYLVAPTATSTTLTTPAPLSASEASTNTHQDEASGVDAGADAIDDGVQIVEVLQDDFELVKPPPPPHSVFHVPIAIIDDDSDVEEDQHEEDDAHDTNADDDDGSEREIDENVQELWKCRACTLLNPVSSAECDVCGLIREAETTPATTPATVPAPGNNQTYLQLVNLDNEDLVRNVDTFECLVCLADCPPGEGVTLRECLHQFCRACLAGTVQWSEDAVVVCPYRDAQYSCDCALQEREVKALVPAAVFEQHLAKSVQQLPNAFHCKTPDCTGWCIYEDNINHFHCPVCLRTNCLTCQAIHTGMDCLQYQRRGSTDEDVRTRHFLDEMIGRGEALACPTCSVVLLKKWGCDWLRCSMCKTEICWVTRGPRWGPAGKGDTSAGCQCGLNGQKCHPNCNYCH